MVRIEERKREEEGWANGSLMAVCFTSPFSPKPGPFLRSSCIVLALHSQLDYDYPELCNTARL